MNDPMAVFLKTLNIATLKCAAIIVPRRDRSNWLKEWESEFWYVYQACISEPGPSCTGEKEVAAFCLGAFNDAFWLRRSAPRIKLGKIHPLRSAAQCTFLLSILAMASYAVLCSLPAARTALQTSPFHHARDLVMISTDAPANESIPTIRVDQYRSWKHHAQHIFTDFAFYQPTIKSIRIAPHKTPELSIARSSPNIFRVLGVPIKSPYTTLSTNEDLPKLVLSSSTWHKYFAADPHVIGSIINVGLRKVRVAGIVADESWWLPGKVDAWLLENDEPAAAIPDTARGFVIAHLSPSLIHAGLNDRWQMTIPWGRDASQVFNCISLAEQAHSTFNIFVFTVLLALLSLPATTSIPLGEYPPRKEDLGWTVKFRRWVFLCSKIALILPIVYCVSVDLAHCSASITPLSSQYIQIVSSFSICLFAFRWALRDQRKRCPVCLRLLTNPARVGQPSRNFLAFNGTELLCGGGHGLLHVPELSTSWLSTQRWLYLDPSWKGLFSESYLTSVETH